MKTDLLSSRPYLYRSRDGVLLGVCKGLSEYLGISPFWVRFATVGIAFFTAFWPTVIVYFAAAIFMKPEPLLRSLSDSESEFYNSYVSSRAMALERLKRKFEEIERRTRRIESVVTASEFDWDQRFNSKKS